MKFTRDHDQEILSFLGEGVDFHGELAFAHGIRIDGCVRGRIRSESCLLIGPKGKVEAEIVIRRVTINGEFHGVIHAAERVEIHKQGRVYGEINTPCLIIEAGALFEGKCNMNQQRPAKAAEAQASGEPHA